MTDSFNTIVSAVRKNLPVDFLRFLVVGGASTVINYGIFFLLYRYTAVPYAWASTIGYVSGLLFGYVLNRSWSFVSVLGNQIKEFGLYFAVYAVGLGVNILILETAVRGAGLSPLAANILAITASTLTNFFGCKYIVFNQNAHAKLQKVATYLTPAFWIILAIKIASSFFFASHYATEGFLPFVSYFITTFKNPYDFFSALGLSVFPYPAGMLFFMSAPFVVFKALLPAAVFGSINIQLFLLRVPVLLADVLIYIILCYLLPFKEKKVLWLYFASPILFYINYYHGQLDVIPTALLLLSLLLIFRKKDAAAFLVLGLGIATKTHLLVALPFYCVYFYRERGDLWRITRLVILSAATFVVVNLPALSGGFFHSILGSPEAQRLFYLSIPFVFNGLAFYVAPAVLLIIFYKFASQRKLNKDSLLLTIGLSYTVLISLVPPMQGWFYWALPFLVFFFVKFKNAPLFSFWMMNVFFILYFLFARDGDVFQCLAPIAPALAAIPAPFTLLANAGVNAGLLESLLFTCLEASLVMNAFWAYRVGMSSNKIYQNASRPFIFGIAGDSGVGKSTLAAAYGSVVGSHNLVCVNGDDLHKWERGHENWKAVTHLNPKGNYTHLDLEQAMALARGENVTRPAYDHATGKFEAPVTLEAKKFILFQGLMPFVLQRMRELFNFRIYMEADEEVRVNWKLGRDTAERAQSREAIEEQIRARAEDARKFIHPQRDFADLIIRYATDALGALEVSYWIKNSFFMDTLVERLEQVEGFHIAHQYVDIEFQKITFSGDISVDEVEKIAYQLFPNIIDLIENYPAFESGIAGVHQLFFVGILQNFYKLSNDLLE